MSNPNVKNLNNLDGRYAISANINSAIATQAATSAGQYPIVDILSASIYSNFR